MGLNSPLKKGGAGGCIGPGKATTPFIKGELNYKPKKMNYPAASSGVSA